MGRDGSGAFSFRVARVSGTVVVTASGMLDGVGAAALGDALLDLIEDQGNLDVVVDVRRLRVGTPADVAVLAAAARSATRLGGRLLVADPADDVAAALDAAGLGARTVFSGGGPGGAAPSDGPRHAGRPDGPAHAKDGWRPPGPGAPDRLASRGPAPAG